MAEVFKAKIMATHGFEKQLVIKRILPQLAADKNFVAMFIDEAKLTAQLTHPKIVQITDFGEVGGQYFIALEFIDGFDVLALLRAAATKQIRIPIPIAMFITMELLDALDYAHNATDVEGKPMHLVHRDISPSNVFIARRGDVKLADFGIAHAQERESKTQAGTLKGKYGYMSPEQVVGGKLDARSDIFAVGIFLAELLMGRRLFTAPNDLDVLLMVRDGRLGRLDKYANDLPPELDAIVRKALAKRASDRYQSAAEFREALADLLFAYGLRVTASDLGRISADYLDKSPESRARLVEQCKRWDVHARAQQLAGGLGTDRYAFPARSTPGGSASHLVPASSSGSRPMSSGAAPPGDSADLIQVDVGDEEPAPREVTPEPSSRSRPGSSIDAQTADALNRLLSQPLSVVDLDKYQQPIAINRTATNDVAPGVPIVPTRAPDGVVELGAVTAMRLLADLAVGKETGMVHFETPGVVRQLYVVAGVPHSAASSQVGERFGAYLTSRSLITSDQLSVAMRQLPSYGGRLGDALVGRGYLRQEDVLRFRCEHIRERILDLLTVKSGRVALFRGMTNPQELHPLPIDPFEILGAGVLALPIDYFKWRFAGWVDLRPVLVTPPRVAPEAFHLGPTPRDLWQILDGSRTLREWASQFSASEEQVTFLRTLYLLFETGLAKTA